MLPKPAGFGRRPVATERDLFGVAAAVADDERPVALFGSWAGGGAIIASEPLVCLPNDCDPFATLAQVPVLGNAADKGVGGGWFGYLGYQLGRRLERVAPPAGEVRSGSDFDLAFYDSVLRYDANRRRLWFECLWTEERAQALDRRYLELVARLSTPAPPAPTWFAGNFQSQPTNDVHVESIERAIEHIRAGDVFQVNVCMRLEADLTLSGVAARPPHVPQAGRRPRRSRSGAHRCAHRNRICIDSPRISFATYAALDMLHEV